MYDPLPISRRTVVQGLGAIAAASVPEAFAAQSTLVRARTAGRLVVGISSERPYAFLDVDGRLRGAVPDVLLAALKPQGLQRLEAQVVDFNALIPGLNAGRFDVIGTGMYIRPARCRSIAFSNPITRTGGGLIVRKADPIVAGSLADLAQDVNLRVGTQSGSTQVEQLIKAGVPRHRMVLFARADEAVAGLQAKRCDVVYFPALQVNEILNTFKDKSLARVERFATEMNYQAFGVRKQDDDLRAAINAGVARMIADGSLLTIIQGYGYGQREIPDPRMTADDLCAG
jgi:polar amino acid transport system substrate-binding protein